MKNFKKSNSKGFTIIEVLIVLAIAGLILLVVFLAVPALQRNGRTTTKRGDVNKSLGAVGEFSANNNGKVPLSTDLTTIASLANLSSATTLNAAVPTTKATVVLPSNSEIEIVTGVTCDPTVSHVTATVLTAANYIAEVKDATARAIVALYSVESSGGQYTTQCTGS